MSRSEKISCLRCPARRSALALVLAVSWLAACEHNDDEYLTASATGGSAGEGGAAGGGNHLTSGLEELKDDLAAADADGNLVVEVGFEGGEVVVELEDGTTLSAAEAAVTDVVEAGDDWQIEFTFSDDSTMTVGALGNDLTVEVEDVEVDPFGFAPLSARIQFSTPVAGRFNVRVVGQDGPASDFVGAPTAYASDHELLVLGLYADYANEVELSFTAEDGTFRVSKTLEVAVEPLPDIYPEFVVETPYQEAQPTNTVLWINYAWLGAFISSDPFGKTRHVLIPNSDLKRGMIRLRNGNIAYGDQETSEVCEYTWLGEHLNTWPVPSGYREIHHDVYEKPNGNFLITANEIGADTIEDIILEMDRESGELVRLWDLKESLQQNRRAYHASSSDWFHANAVVHDESDGSIIVSGRHQGVVKLTRDNELVWIIAPVEGWNEEFLPYVLQLEEGSEPCWGQHTPELLPNGNVLVFDNGVGRDFDGSVEYSRIVEYEITPNADGGGTAREVFEYGEDRPELFSPLMSDVDSVGNAGNRLMVAGALSVEVDYGGPTDYASHWINAEVEKGRLIEVNPEGEVEFELVVNDDSGRRGPVYRGEKLVLEF